ncbi:glycosyltransferase [Persephonella sp.]|uniref:glycosyltransferase n=1 Tax=Persephonella sp. TaxID=2060922 RepID=UPI0026147C19|nr:glycosyltransferase [Persephonella sp.]
MNNIVKLVPIIVTYNRLEKLKIAVNTWLKTDIYKLVIVNNASTDDTKSYLEKISKENNKLVVINLEKNTGGAGGFYKGIEYAFKEIDFDWIVLQDDDAYPDVDSINYFLNEKDLSTADAYMSAVYYPSGKISLMNMPGYLPFKTFKQSLKTMIQVGKGFHIDKNLYYLEEEHIVDFASFVGLFIKKEVIEKVGLPKKEFFIYGDDIEYTVRITKSGFKIKFDPKLRFFHDCETLHFDKRKIYKPLWKAYFTYRNGIILYKQLSGKLFPLVLLNKMLIWTLNGLFYSNKTDYYKLLWKSIIDGIKENTQDNAEIINKFNKL